MKIMLFALCTSLLLFTSCVDTSNEVEQEGVPELNLTNENSNNTYSSIEQEKMQDFKEYKTYLDPLNNALLTGINFNKDEVEDSGFSFYYFYSNANLGVVPPEGDRNLGYLPAKEMEDYLLTYFELDVQDIRKSASYDDKSKGYYIPDDMPYHSDSPLGYHVPSYTITNVKIIDGVTKIYYDISYNGTISNHNILNVKINNNDFKYISNQVTLSIKELQKEEKYKLDQKYQDNLPRFNVSEIPKMSLENQEYYDKYLKMLDEGTSFFSTNFSENNFEFFNAGIMYSILENNKVFLNEVPQDVVENKVKEYFPISSEIMREKASTNEHYEQYSSEKQCYLNVRPVNVSETEIPPYMKTPPYTRGIVIDSRLYQDVLLLTTQWYTFEQGSQDYVLNHISLTTIQLKEDESCFFLENQVFDFSKLIYNQQ